MYEQEFIQINSVIYSMNKSRAWELTLDDHQIYRECLPNYRPPGMVSLFRICLHLINRDSRLMAQMVLYKILPELWGEYFVPLKLVRPIFIRHYPEWRGGTKGRKLDLIGRTKRRDKTWNRAKVRREDAWYPGEE